MRSVPWYVIPAVSVVAVAWAIVYVANLNYTYHTRRVALEFSGAAHQVALRVERGLRRMVASGEAASLVDGPLPFPLSDPTWVRT